MPSTDRGIGNEYSDEDEEQEFSSNEDNDDGLSGYAAKRNYASKRDNYRKLERNENLVGAQVDSDSDFEVKVKGSRANKMSRVSVEGAFARAN
jgi:phosphofurin acidic cluster sorting protein 2